MSDKVTHVLTQLNWDENFDQVRYTSMYMHVHLIIGVCMHVHIFTCIYYLCMHVLVCTCMYLHVLVDGEIYVYLST